MRQQNTLMICLFMVAGLAHAQEDLASKLFGAQSLQCHFKSGISTQWSADKPRTLASDYNEYIIFAAIDSKNQSARRIVGNVTEFVNIKLLANKSGISFFETDESAGKEPEITAFSITTVFPVLATATGFITTETRYTTISGNVTAEQYFGTCRTWP